MVSFCLVFGVQLTSIAEGLLGTIAPVFTEAYSILFQKRVFLLRSSLGCLLLFWAHTLISQSSFSDTSSLGNLLAFFVLLQWRLYFLLEKMLGSVGLFEYSRWLFLYAAACLFVISLYQGVSVLSFNYQDFGWFVFLAAIPTMVGHNIFYFLVKTLSATTIAAVLLESLLFLCGAFFLFGEPVGLFVLGGSITLGCLYNNTKRCLNRHWGLNAFHWTIVNQSEVFGADFKTSSIELNFGI